VEWRLHAASLERAGGDTAMKTLRIVTLGLGTARQKLALE
jgi:hypothetical protein